MKWQDAYNNSIKPNFLDLKGYLSEDAFDLFNKMNHQLAAKYPIKGIPAQYNKKDGWVFPYCVRGIKLFRFYVIDENTFRTDDIVVRKASDLDCVINEMNHRCESGFMDKVNIKQKERKERAAHRKMWMYDSGAGNKMQQPEGSKPEMLNKYHWIPAVSTNQLRKLYHAFAMGITDSELLDDVGLQFYIRCQQGTEEYRLSRLGKVKCHNCGTILEQDKVLIQCQCGYQYTLKGYIASFNEHRMPGGNAQHIFIEYLNRWQGAHTDAEKMNTIDWLIHQCHVSMASGLELRSVLKNLIDAPTRNTKKLIMELAYGKV